jgi:hypothetical protein
MAKANNQPLNQGLIAAKASPRSRAAAARPTTAKCSAPRTIGPKATDKADGVSVCPLLDAS